MKTIWNKETGEAKAYESVDAREVMKNSDLYTDVDPNPPKKDKDGKLVDKDGNIVGTGPQNVANVENEFRREPVGDDVPAPEREGVIIRNPVTDQPLMAPKAGTDPAVHNVIGDNAGDSVAKGPQGHWYVMHGKDRVSKGFATEGEAKASMSKAAADRAAADRKAG